MTRILLGMLALTVTLAAQAAFELPKAAAKALGVTRGKRFSSGLVFVNGKYLPPPYTIERWGTGIRINRQPVTGEIISWEDFLRTQTGFKVSKSVAAEPSVQSEAVPAADTQSTPPAANSEESEEDSSLDDLFDDDPKPKKTSEASKGASSKNSTPAVKKPAAKPKPAVSYSFDGEFAANDKTREYLARINSLRTDIDRTLRAGGFVCFGERYARVTGDERTAAKIMSTLPELMQRSETAVEFRNAVRSAGLFFFPDQLCDEIFRNRVDYRRLQERRAQQQKEQEWNRVLEGVAAPAM